MGNGSWTITGNATVTVWNISNTATLTFTKGNSTINITDIASNAKTFGGGGLTYNNLTISGGGSGAVTFTGNNTFNNFTIGAPKTVTFTAGTTQTINGTFTATGSAGNVITLNSSSGGSAATISHAGSFSTIWNSIQDITSTGGSWNAAYSTDVSGNTGITFTRKTWRPISDSTPDWPFPGTNNYAEVDEAVADDLTTYIGTATAVIEQIDIYNITNDPVPTGATNISVTIYYRGRMNNGFAVVTTAYFTGGINVGGTNYKDSNRNPATTWTDYNKVYATNPAGGDWTVEAVNAIKLVAVGKGVYVDDEEDYCLPQFTQIYAVVDYVVLPFVPRHGFINHNNPAIA